MDKPLTIKQTLNKAFFQVATDAKDLENFKQALRTFLCNTEDGQSEDTQKNHLQTFLKQTFFDKYYVNIDENRIDLTIHTDEKPQSPIGVLVEVKSTTNVNEMLDENHLNRKALQELLYYYLKERFTNKNNDIKFIIATNITDYYVFDAHTFEDNFYNNKSLIKEFKDFVEG